MKKYHFSFVFCLITSFLFAQPAKLWTKLVGGTDADYCYSSGFFNDTLILNVGKTLSPGLGNKGGFDALISSINTNGQVRLLRSYGTSLNEQYNSWLKINDTTAFLVGYSLGSGGDFPASYGGTDAILTAFNPTNNRKIFDKNFGGTNTDQFNDILFVESGRIMVAGMSRSVDKDLPSRAVFGDDGFVGAITETGAKADNLFKVIAGSKAEAVKKLLKSELRTFVILGDGQSNDGDFTGLTNAGGRDIFMIKSNQALQFGAKTMIGGPGDDVLVDAVVLKDNSIMIFATVSMSGGQVGTIKGGKDIWVLKYDQASKLLWKKLIGGTKDDEPVKATITANDEIYLLANSLSSDGDFKANYGSNDINLLKLDTAGKILWIQNFGGKETDKGGDLISDGNGYIYTVGESFSKDRDLDATNTQAPDLWIMKLFECSPVISNYSISRCLGDTALVNGNKYYAGRSTGSDTLKAVTVNKCDSIVNVSVEFKAVSQSNFTDTLCNDATLRINNIDFNKNKTSHSFPLRTVDGCDSLHNVNLTFLAELTTKNVTIVKDDGTGSGSIEVAIEGGLPPYKFKWQNGADVSKLINQNAGNYNLTVTDANGCQKNFSFVIGTTVGIYNQSSYYIEIFEGDGDFKLRSNHNLVRVEAFDLNGKLIKIENLVPQKEHKIQTRNFPKGLIIINVYNDNNEKKGFQLFN